MKQQQYIQTRGHEVTFTHSQWEEMKCCTYTMGNISSTVNIAVLLTSNRSDLYIFTKVKSFVISLHYNANYEIKQNSNRVWTSFYLFLRNVLMSSFYLNVIRRTSSNRANENVYRKDTMILTRMPRHKNG